MQLVRVGASTSDAISFSNGTALPKFLPAGALRRPCPRDVVLPTAHETLLLELLTTEAGPWGARAAGCGPTDKPKRAALLLRGLAPANESLQREVGENYRHRIVCPLERAGFAVESFFTSYTRAVAGIGMVLKPTLLTVMPQAKSSNLASTLAAVTTFYRHSEAAPAPYDLVVLTRFDLQLKHPLLSLPGLRLDALNFVFSEARQLVYSDDTASACSTTPPDLPASRAAQGSGRFLRAPERCVGTSEACRGPSSPRQAAPKLRMFHVPPAGLRRVAPGQLAQLQLRLAPRRQGVGHAARF